MLAYLAADIGPEFLDDECECVVTDLRSPHADSIFQGTVTGVVPRIALAVKSIKRAARVVAIRRNGRSEGGANDFRVVKLIVTGVGAGHEGAADGVSGAMNEAALSGLKKAGILVKDGGEDRADNEILDRSIGEVGGVAFAVTGRALAEPRLAVFRLANTGEESVPDSLDGIEGTSGDNLVFLASR